MKEIIAIVRPAKMNSTKQAMDDIGYPGMTALAVMGKGHQRGIAGEVTTPIDPSLIAKEKSIGMRFIPKRMFSIIVKDEDVSKVVDTIIRCNQTASIGDGKIFVCPVEKTVRVRTKETDNDAI